VDESYQTPNTKELPQEESFESKRLSYFASIAVRHRELLALHREAGQTQRDAETYGVDEEGKPKRWGDPTEHCLVEAAASEILSDMIGLSEKDKDDFFQAAFVHDYRKKGEIEELRGVKDPALVEASYKKTKDILRKKGVSDEVVDLIETVAHTSLPQFAELNDQNELVLKEGVPLVSMVMHYLDDVTKGSDLVPFDERIDFLESRTHLYPYNEEGRALWGGRTFFEAQRQVGHLIEERLAKLAGVADPKQLPLVIRDKLVERINNS
jgi:hypothetical protein